VKKDERFNENGNKKTFSVKIREFPNWIRNWVLGNPCQLEAL